MSIDIDLASPGKQYGRINVPYSHNLGGWARETIPVISIRAGGVKASGPTALVLGGNHGDEYEGPIAISALARRLDVQDLAAGHVIMIPCLSMQAAEAGTRLWPDGTNFNRSFPGSPSGSVSEQLAYYLTNVLFPMADIVVDLHSGGRSMRMYPMSHMHLVEDRTQRAAMLEAMLVWNTDFHMLYTDVAGSGLLPSEAERQGKIVVTTELGGGGHVTAATHRLAEEGLLNTLRHFGIVKGEVKTRQSMGMPEATILSALSSEHYVFAPESGMFETLFDPGDQVITGDILGRLHFFERPDRSPTEMRAPKTGIICAVRAHVPTRQGDCVAVIGEPVAKEDLL